MSNTDDEGLITANLRDGKPINLAKTIPAIPRHTPLLIGVAKPVIRGLVTQYGLVLVEMAEIDEIAVLNSIPTAEGAIQVAMENTEITIHGSRCLVLGLGRCGTTLARKLVALGANVTVSSRSAADLARAAALNCEPLPLAELHSKTDFQIIFNTIPALVLPRSYLRLLDAAAVIVDISSGPGGTDFCCTRAGDPGCPCPFAAGQGCAEDRGGYPYQDRTSPTGKTVREEHSNDYKR